MTLEMGLDTGGFNTIAVYDECLRFGVWLKEVNGARSRSSRSSVNHDSDSHLSVASVKEIFQPKFQYPYPLVLVLEPQRAHPPHINHPQQEKWSLISIPGPHRGSVHTSRKEYRRMAQDRNRCYDLTEFVMTERSEWHTPEFVLGTS